MTANDAFPIIDPSAVSGSSDLFGGDLFGDELMDMYNSHADTTLDDTGGVGVGVAVSTADGMGTGNTNSVVASSHQGAQVAMTAAALDDGLGAFRPSTSFNDFGSTDASPPHRPAGRTLPGSASPTIDGSTASSAGQSWPATSAARAARAGVAKNSVAGIGNTGGILSPSPKAPPTGTAKKRARGTSTAAATSHDPKKRRAGASQAAVAAANARAAVGQGVAHPISPTTRASNAVSALAASGRKGGKTKNLTSVASPLASQAGSQGTGGMAGKVPVTAYLSRRVSADRTSTAHALVAGAGRARPHQSVPTTVAAKANTAAPLSKGKSGKELTERDFRGVAQAAVKNLMASAHGPSKNGNSNSAGKTTATTASATATAPGPASVSIGKPGPLTTANASPSHVTSASVLNDPNRKPINISTAHIAALTSSNWVQACSEGVDDAYQAAALAAAAAASDPAQSKAARARRANLTPDERARQNRDRNREHARNTRLRKKAYVEELKKTLTELVAQRDAAELEKRHDAQRDLEVREVRFRVMEEFLKLRGQGDNHSLLSRWAAIMEDGFALTLPRTDYRPTVHPRGTSASGDVPRSVSVDGSSITSSSTAALFGSPVQILKGPNECMQDAANLAFFVNTFGNTSASGGASTAGSIRFAYHCDRKEFMMDGVNAVLQWTASTAGAVTKGAPADLVVRGTMHANFSPASNKLNSVELLFDTGVVAIQAKSLIVTPTVVTSADILSTGTTTNAHAAAEDANALLDSLEMPHIDGDGAISTIVSTGSVSSSDGSSDSKEPVASKPNSQEAMAIRRSTRVH